MKEETDYTEGNKEQTDHPDGNKEQMGKAKLNLV